MKYLPTILTILLLSLAGCDRADHRDDTPRPRIVTLSPALTAIVFDMGLGDHVVGVSEYAAPPDGQSRPIVGDSQNVRTTRLAAS